MYCANKAGININVPDIILQVDTFLGLEKQEAGCLLGGVSYG